MVRLHPAAAKRLAGNGLVSLVESDQIVRTVEATQANAPWGLDRLDSRSNNRDMRYSYTASGQNVHAYIVDSGLRGSHAELAGRVGNGFDATSGGTTGGLLSGLLGGGLLGGGLLGLITTTPAAPAAPSSGTFDPSSNPPDCSGHGTHVAGTLGGRTYGVAKDVIFHGVRVVNCQGVGTSSSTIAGIDWVVQNHAKPAVMNLSLGGGASAAVDQAIRTAVARGIVTVVAAGNENDNACDYSPAREPAAITVASTDIRDRRSSFSNVGSCVDLFAPGSDIASAGIRNDNEVVNKSGTSMASPHVAGAAAKLLSKGIQPADVAVVLSNESTANAVQDPQGTLNRLLYSR